MRVVDLDEHTVEIELDARTNRPVFAAAVPVEAVGVEIAVVLALRELHVARSVLAALLSDPGIAESVLVANVLVCRRRPSRHLDVDFVVHDIVRAAPLELRIVFVVDLLVLERPHRAANTLRGRDLGADLVAARGEVVARHSARADALAVRTRLAALRDSDNIPLVQTAVRLALENVVPDIEVRGNNAAVVVLAETIEVYVAPPVLVCRVPLCRINRPRSEIVVEDSPRLFCDVAVV